MEERPGLMRRWRRQWKATRMLQNVNVLEAAHAVDQRGGQLHDEVHALTEHRREQRQSLERLLSLPEDTYAANPLLNDPSAIVIQYIRAEKIQLRDIAAYSRVSRSWHVAVRAWLVSAAARPFWHRMCAAMKLITHPERGVLQFPVPILHPELCTKETLLDWVRFPMAVGTREQWDRASFGREEDADAMTELELASSLAQLFALWWNVEDNGPCPFGAFWLHFHPFLDGTTHESEAQPVMQGSPGDWNENVPMSMLASVCDRIQEFRYCPALYALPTSIEDAALKTLRALITHFKIPSPGEAQYPEGMPEMAPPVKYRYMQLTDEQNAAFYDLLRRYAPLFPQKSDEAPEMEVEVEPVFVKGKRHTYPMPRPHARPLMPTPYNQFLVLDSTNTDEDQEAWKFYVGETEKGAEEGDAPSDDEMDGV